MPFRVKRDILVKLDAIYHPTNTKNFLFKYKFSLGHGPPSDESNGVHNGGQTQLVYGFTLCFTFLAMIYCGYII